MYNVLLVDDEEVVRTGMRLKIDWGAYGFQIIGEARDGREALSKLEDNNVDVMITDIRMPVMSGLELLKRCAELYPRLQVIVLSGYDDFHYVKAAIQCGARDYLLKPIVRSELKTILEKLHHELNVDRQSELEYSTMRYRMEQTLPALRESLMVAMVSDEGEEHLAALHSDITRLGLTPLVTEKKLFRIVCVEMRMPTERLKEGAEQIALFRLAFQMICRETAENTAFEHYVGVFHHPNYPNMMHFLLTSQTTEHESLLLEALIGEIHSNMDSFLRAVSIIAVGNSISGLAELRQSFLSSLLAWSHSQPGAVSQTLQGEMAREASEGMPLDVEKHLMIALDDINYEQFVSTLEEVFGSKAHSISLQSIHAMMMRVVLLLDQAVTKNGLAIHETQDWLFPITQWKFTTAAAALSYLSELAGRVMDDIKHSRLAGGAGVVEGVRQYLETHYMNEISLSTTAVKFHINTTYLSELFKKQIGITFSDYLTQVRTRQAAELLIDPNLRLADIAELVGIASASYLSSVFKKMYGVSPNEYRTRLTEEGGNANR